mmetsp:Transcript_9446/g.23168  ORF Transcript_9446/g.23168 Transcript_9446/m.23168 type:complete len:490 (+) Transcript_9446:504-1973(+)
MPKAFCHLAAALACISFAQLSSTSVVVSLSRVYATRMIAVSNSRKKRSGILPDVPPEAAANLLGALGTGEGALMLNTLSMAARKSVADMHSAGHPEAHPEKLRVGKLLAAMRDGKRPNLNWNSLPAWATPEVARVAIEERQISTPEQWDSVPDAAREKPEVVKLAIRRHLLSVGVGVDLIPKTGWTSVSLPAAVLANPDPEVVKLAIDERLISTPEEWDSLPAAVRAKPELVIVAIESGLLELDTPEQWNSLPANVREHPGVLQAHGQREAADQLIAAIVNSNISGEASDEEQDPLPHDPTPLLRVRSVVDIDWDSLLARAWPKVIREAIESELISTPEQWDSLPTAVRKTPEVVMDAVCQRSPLELDRPALLHTREQWNSFPADVREHPLVVRAALASCDLISTPEQYLEVPAGVRDRGDVAKLAFYCGFFQSWDQAPAVLRNDAQVVADAIHDGEITTFEQWNSLPVRVREVTVVESAFRLNQGQFQ